MPGPRVIILFSRFGRMSPSLNILGPVPSWLLAPKTATQSKLSDNYPRIEEIFAVVTVSSFMTKYHNNSQFRQKTSC